MTLVEDVLDVQVRLEALREEEGRSDAAREFAIALTLSEDLIMRINRGMAKKAGTFTVADVEATLQA